MEKNLKEKNLFSKLRHTNTIIGLSIMAILVIGLGVGISIALYELGSADTAKAARIHGFICTAVRNGQTGSCFRAYLN